MTTRAKRRRRAGERSPEQLRVDLDEFRKADVIIDLGGGALMGTGRKITIEESDEALRAMRALVESQVEDHVAAHPDVA